MKTKSGESVPASLAAKLASARTRAAWDRLRPSCQRDYAARVARARGADAKATAITRVVELTRAYAARHPAKARAS